MILFHSIFANANNETPPHKIIKMSSETKDNGFTPLGATLDNDNQPTVELPPSSENGMFFLFLLKE